MCRQSRTREPSHSPSFRGSSHLLVRKRKVKRVHHFTHPIQNLPDEPSPLIKAIINRQNFISNSIFFRAT
ncbi:hypothetical protein AQUCO_00700375v1 [Aquilegia coerulea]|uniref:Uncharacterized protein n=1 Tax=Aquilegia coerulea TaxID=218851 RepID=A0A2G5EJS1_AQUCA|nr:hypothetical protein AQUCO_00700375v1 [Aquilegia coerulea]